MKKSIALGILLILFITGCANRNPGKTDQFHSDTLKFTAVWMTEHRTGIIPPGHDKTVGLKIVKVSGDSPLSQADLNTGDEIWEVNKRGFESRKEFRQALGEAVKTGRIILSVEYSADGRSVSKKTVVIEIN